MSINYPSKAEAEPAEGGDLVSTQTRSSSENEVQEETEQERSRPGSSTSSEVNDSTTDIQHGDTEPDLEAPLSRTSTAPFSVFTTPQKRFIVFMVSLASFFSPLSANIYFPALNTLSRDFNVSPSTMNLTLTSYMIFQGLAPTLFGDLADMAGRRPAYLIGFAIYLGACIGIALCDSFAALLVLRCLQSSGSSSTIALGLGVVADIATSAERGVWMGWATSGPMIAPALAPVLGGLFTEFLGWRWIFWFLVILTCAVLVPLVMIFPETGRNVVGNGSIAPQGWNMSLLNYLQVKRQHGKVEPSPPPPTSLKTHLRLPNPLNSLRLLLEKDVSLLLIYNALIYSSFYCLMSSFPQLLSDIYGFNPLQIGLCFLPLGSGAFLATFLSGHILDWNFRRIAAQLSWPIVKNRSADLGAFPIERARLQITAPCVFLGSVALIAVGWCLHYEVPLAAPLVLSFIHGLFMTAAFNTLSVLLVDLYPTSPATATAGNNLVRYLFGAAATAVILDVLKAMGRGGGFTFVAGVVIAGSPVLWVLEKWGMGWRAERKEKIQAKKEKKAEAKECEKVDDETGAS
ncbi:MFS transporter like protein [Zymoseptoria brevis]|uniref:MFS transporter like protein n=1 Tax=Zymoseptoria brevis TaxID=1047168 RepID=A0A0F4GUA4_9PEZI|nr:MFS transporter like protein [Zymoseptoria brevis]